mmetsp:Transcript_5797/g.21938  ORF Transcript_5797/g.21938 Transcript_5797/m.21938 type:complete len:360 (-) Transcript_5797:21-1100(-)
MTAVDIPVTAELRPPSGDVPEDAPADGWFSENSGSGRLVTGLTRWFSGDEKEQRARDDAACVAKHAAHHECVEALLLRFGTVGGMTRDSLARFSAARGDKLDSASCMVEKHLDWRSENLPIDANELGVANALAANVFARVGKDKEGRPVLLFAAHRHKQRDGRAVGDVIKAMTLVMEAAVAEAMSRKGDDDADEEDDADGDDGEKLRKENTSDDKNTSDDENKETKHKPQHPRDDPTTGRFSLILFAPSGTELDLRLVSALAQTFQDNYPERLHKLYALPTGVVTRVAWEAVRPFLSHSVASKVVLASGGRRPVELSEALPLPVLRHALVPLDPMEEGEEDPWDVSDDEDEFVDAEEDE